MRELRASRWSGIGCIIAEQKPFQEEEAEG
jgi:hypothetical protein